MTAPTDARDLIAAAEQLDDQGADRLRELRAQQAELDARQVQERALIAAELAAAEARFNAVEAERLREERLRADREAQEVAEVRAFEVATRIEELASEVVEKTDELITSFYAWLEAQPTPEGPWLIIRATDPTYMGAVTAMIDNCADPRLRSCRIVGPAPLRFS